MAWSQVHEVYASLTFGLVCCGDAPAPRGGIPPLIDRLGLSIVCYVVNVAGLKAAVWRRGRDGWRKVYLAFVDEYELFTEGGNLGVIRPFDGLNERISGSLFFSLLRLRVEVSSVCYGRGDLWWFQRG